MVRPGPTVVFARPAPQKINNRLPINYRYSGGVYELQGNLGRKYPHRVPFNMFGQPDFSRYAQQTVNIGMYQGYRRDFRKANELAFGKNNKYGAEPPSGFTWHHDKNGIMQLVPRDIHYNVRHTGGIAVSRQQVPRPGVCRSKKQSNVF